jgi:beta-lactamase regulating signal transducer with metallopeptidase domain
MSDLTVFANTAAVSVFVKVTVVLAAAIVIQQLLRRRSSAAARHAVLTLAVAGVLILPVVSLVAPEWGLVRRDVSSVRAADSEPAAIGGVEQTPLPPLPSLGRTPEPASREGRGLALTLIYAAGVAVVLLYLVAQHVRSRRFVLATTVVDDRDWQDLFAQCIAAAGIRRTVALRRSREHNVPLAIGIRQPCIIIPAIADAWDEGRRRAVLLHELAHVARHDCLTQMVSVVSCAVYWCHPAMWWVARQLRIERELACDDRVIAAGAGGSDYAGHLLEIAYATGNSRSVALAVGMARRTQLEGRLLAAIDEKRNRRVPRMGSRVVAVAMSILTLVAIAGARASVEVRGDEKSSSLAHASVTALPDWERQPAVDKVQQRLTRIPERLLRIPAHLLHAAMNIGSILQNNLPGTWEIRPTATEGVVHLRLVEFNSSSGTNVPVAQLGGLTASQLTGAGGPVQFRIRRDAGTFTFEGVIRNGVGAGTFSFTPDANFPAEMARRGFTQPTSGEQYQLARYDIGFAFVDELNRQGYTKPQMSDLVRAGQHGVGLTYMREMGALGYRLGTLQPLITLRDHGVTPEYVRQLADFGYKNLTADDVRNARDHGVSGEYVSGMREAGYGSQTLAALINARDHGVTPEYVRTLDQAGYRKTALEDVIRVRDHGVSPEYVLDMHEIGFKVPLDDLVRARDHGVGPEFAKEIKSLGYDGLTLDDLISLRDHGVTPDKIKRANARAGSRLPIDMLRSLAAGGMR